MRGWVAVVLALALVGCAPGPNPAEGTGEAAGFLLGLWHGLICVFTFFGSLFTDEITIYEVHNAGGWYDAGFLIGASSALGGSGAGAHRQMRGGA